MATYFVFSDESGAYQEKYKNRGHKYFVRSALLFNAENWIVLKDGIDQLKRQAGIPVFKEFKWNYRWHIILHQKGERLIRDKDEFYPFRNHNVGILIEFVRQSILLFHKYTDSKIIYTFTENKPVKRWRLFAGNAVAMEGEYKNPKTLNIYKWHLQDLMERVEMEVQVGNNLAVLWFDEDNKTTEAYLRNSYHDIYQNGDFIEKYKHIKDSLCFEDSRHSTGIQIADYIAGILNGFLNDDDISYDLMKDCILPILCKNSLGNYLGYGIKEVPKNEGIREALRQKINDKLVCITPKENILPPFDVNDIPF